MRSEHAVVLRRNKCILVILLFLMLVTAAPGSVLERLFPEAVNSVCVKADTGPKPSVDIYFHGISGRYYATLLDEKQSSGPYSTEKEFNGEPGSVDEKVFEAFKRYNDSDGFNFTGFMDECSDNHHLSWGYFPPDNFKILLYFPETQQYVVSEDSQERFAFHTVFDATYKNGELTVTKQFVNSRGSKNGYFTILGRMLYTIFIELIVAFFFHYRNKHYVTTIIGINIVTQVALNFILQIGYRWFCSVSFFTAQITGILWLLLLEVAVFVFETFCYIKIFESEFRHRHGKEVDIYRGKIVAYTAVANVLSFILGALLQILPDIL